MSNGRSLLGRRRGSYTRWRTGLLIFLGLFIWFQLAFLSFRDANDPNCDFNDSNAAIMSMVPAVLHKFLTPKPKNSTTIGMNGTITNSVEYKLPINISEIKRNIALYNSQQTVHNEDTFGPLQNDSIVIVIQVGANAVILAYEVSVDAHAQLAVKCCACAKAVFH